MRSHDPKPPGPKGQSRLPAGRPFDKPGRREPESESVGPDGTPERRRTHSFARLAGAEAAAGRRASWYSSIARIVPSSLQRAIQRAVVKPLMSGAKKAASVTLDLKAGDQPQDGAPTKGNEVIDGIAEVTEMGLAKSTSAFGFVRFHVLNADNGGKPEPGNLTAATRQANHHKRWEAFEAEENLLIPKGKKVAKATKFVGTVSYHPSKLSTFKRATGSGGVVVDDADYPSKITATITVAGKKSADVTLTGPEDGLIKMSDTKVPHYSAYDDKGKAPEPSHKMVKKTKKKRYSPY